MRNIKFFLKRLNRYIQYHYPSDRDYILKILKPWIAIGLIITICYLAFCFGIDWVLSRIAFLGIIGTLVWWGDLGSK